MSIEVLKQALAALKEYGSHFPYCTQYPTYTRPELEPPCGCGFDMATATLRQAIEQAEKQEPVGFVHPEDLQSVTLGHNSYAAIYVETEGHTGGIPLYTAPPQREWPIGLLDRVKAAEERFELGYCSRHIPADTTDIDLVLAEVRCFLEGKQPPIWLKGLPNG